MQLAGEVDDDMLDRIAAVLLMLLDEAADADDETRREIIAEHLAEELATIAEDDEGTPANARDQLS